MTDPKPSAGKRSPGDEAPIERPDPGDEAGVEQPDPGDEARVEQPGKLLRIAMMIREMLEEVRRDPLDEDAREHLRDVHGRVVVELKGGLSGTLVEELERISLPFGADEVPTQAELRIAQAQLLGWLEGLFHGIQAAIASQQMAAAQQLEEMRRRGLPPIDTESRRPDRPGQYL